MGRVPTQPPNCDRGVIIGLLFQTARIGCLDQDAGKNGGHLADLGNIARHHGKGSGNKRRLIKRLQRMRVVDMGHFMSENALDFIVGSHERPELIGHDNGAVGKGKRIGP